MIRRIGIYNAALVAMLLALDAEAAKPERIRPFVLASTSSPADFEQVAQSTRQSLQGAGFELLGEVSPYVNPDFVGRALVMVVTNPELRAVTSKTELGGFAAPWRVAVTEHGEAVQVSYPNPTYLAAAYRLDDNLDGLRQALAAALGAEQTFGSRRGRSARDLRRYRYMMGMERFDDPYRLATHSDHQQALNTIEQNLAAGVAGLSKVYRLDLADEVTVFGVARKAPSDEFRYMDDQFIMSIVDFKDLKGTAYLPYEIMVSGDQVLAQHMRFRMALHYPDLKMMGKHSFMKLRPSPKAIQAALEKVATAAE